MSDVAFAGAAAQAELIRKKKVSSVELTELYLERIARYDPTLNAFRIVFAERALTEAKQADARRKGKDHRPLLGVPVAVKDDTDMAGEVTTKGSIAHGGPATEDAPIVQRLREDGAVILGRTNVPELMAMAFTETLWYGVTRNPWDTDRTPGGSSGGSAAAVAAGLVAAATASDGAGSIRNPATATGLVGLKAGAGVIPTPHHWNGLDHHGYLTRTTADTALLTGIAPADAEPLRVAWSTKVPVGGLGKPDATVRGGLDAMIAALRGLGHTVTERDPELPFGGGIVARYLRGVADDAASLPHPERLDKRSRGLARLGRLIPEPLFQRALAAAETDRARFSRSFETADVVMMPVINSLPPRIGDYEGMGALASLNRAFAYTPYPGIFNHTGLPAVAVPAGTTPDGFPLGVQFIGPMGSEPRLLALAAQLEDELGWPARRPPGFETGA